MIRLLMRRLLGSLGGRTVLACPEITPAISEFLDRELDPGMMERICEHLEVCSACQRFAESLEKMSRVLREDPSSPIPEEAARELMENLRREYRRALEELDEKRPE